MGAGDILILGKQSTQGGTHVRFYRCGHCFRYWSRYLAKRQGLKIPLWAALTLATASVRALAVWPPSTAFEERSSNVIFGVIVLVFAVGVIIGLYMQKKMDGSSK